MNALGARVYGIAAIMMGVAGLLWADFATGGLRVPATLPGRALLAYAVGALLIAGGALINWRRAWGAALLAAIFGLGFLLVDLVPLIAHASRFDYWEATAEPMAMTMGGLVAFASPSSRLSRIALYVFACCLMVFGTAHFVFAKLSATFVPGYLPPSQMFWVYVTGAAAIAAGLAILSGILALLAARLLTLMYVLFGILVHTPFVLAKPADHNVWIEFMVNLALAGAAWIVADTLAERRR
ncbi:MAG: hypothetical protein ISS15_14355 [Alphaproteobacteria bacterium]|nr:hypothetical protein [Alphaproteobacteria bacterium]MBL6937499.1 hypothetical protein [Alphaproteobacteria bacterium]MBL7098837.1 hypothetical protein [Alphaproteobacteria bacterium]